MKQIYSKMLLLLAMILVGGSAWATVAELSSFATVDGKVDEVISYTSNKGGGTAEPAISSKQLRLYQRASKTSDNTIGGYITITAAKGYKISSVSWGNGIATTYTYSVDEVLENGTNDFPNGDLSAINGSKSTISDLNCSSITLYARGTTSGNRLYLASLSVTYAIESTAPIINASNVTINADAPSGAISYSITNPTTNVNPTATKVSGDWISNVQVDATNKKITFDAEANTGKVSREGSIKISYTGATDKVVKITQDRVPVTKIVDVDGPMTWDFTGYTTDVTTDKDTEFILGNYVTLTTGNADALKGKQQYIVRNNFCWQGTNLIFHPTVPGTVEVLWSSTSGSNYRTLKINDGDYAVEGGSNSTSANGGVTTTADVPANQDVVLTGWNYNKDNGEYTSNQIRIWKITFTPSSAPTSYSLPISSAEYATFYDSKNAYVMPEDCEGYVFTVENGLEVAYEGGDVVPAGEPLVIYTIAPGTKTLTYTTSIEDTYKSGDMNDLEGTDEETAIAADASSYFYALSLDENGENIGFYWMNETGAAFTNGAHKAYLKGAKTSTSAKSFAFNAAATAIKAIATTKETKIFDMTGREVKTPKSGLYIVNGVKKYIK